MTTGVKARRLAGAFLVIVGLALVTWSASAAMDHWTDQATVASPAEAERAATTSPSRAAAKVDVTLPVTGARSESIDLPPLPATLLPGARSVDTGELPLGARVRVALDPAPIASDAPASRAEGSRVSSQSIGLTPGASLALAASAFTIAGLATYFSTTLKAWGHKLLLVPALGLYARITRAEVFDNSVREGIFVAIKAHPGLSASDLAKAAGVSWGTTIYHLDVLEQNRMVTSLRKGRHRRYFENGATLDAPKEAVAVLQNPVTATVVATVKGAPGATQKELASRVGLSPQALHWHLQRLVETGLVRKERDGRVVRHFASA